MLGLTAIRTSKKLTVDKSPTLLPPAPKEEKDPRNVFLDLDLWAELTDAAKFHTEAFKKMDPKNPSVSRNDVIENFLKWALDVYWDDKGGKPKTDAERAAKVAAYAEHLKKQQKSSAKK